MSDLTRIALALLVMALREQEEEPPPDPGMIEIPPLAPEVRTVDRWGPS